MAMAFFFLMAAIYVAAGLLAQRYSNRLRLVLLSVSVLMPAGILAGWASV